MRLVLALILLVSSAHAQWSTDPATNLSVADAASDQILPRIAPTPDGGCWISWFDGIANGFDVRVQKLDAQGNEVFAHNGVLVADRGFSSVQSYGLDADASGNALLTFRDDSGVGIQITAAKVTPAGAIAWNVQLTSTAAFVASPKIAGTSDGGAVVAWTQDSSTKVQKLDSSGVAQWTPEVTLTPGAGSYSASDIHDAGNDAVLAFVHQTGGFGSPRHLLAQKLDASGALLWGVGHVAVFDGGSLQLGNFPEFAPDGSGGGIFAWYSSSPSLQSFAQRVLSNGTEAFAHNGTPVSANATRVRVSPWAAFDAATSETYVFWTEQDSLQSQSGLYGQKLDVAGARQWTNDGSVLLGLGTDTITFVRSVTASTGALVFWFQASGFGQDQVRGGRVDASGAFDVAPFAVASTISGKSRLFAAKSAQGFAITAWSDDRVDEGDVLAQNVNADGTLGNAGLGSPFCFGVGCPCGNDDPSAGCVNSTGSGAVLGASGSTSVAADDLVLETSGCPPNNTGLYFMGGATFPPVFVGDGLGCTGGLFRFFPSVVSGAGVFTLSSPIAQAPAGSITPGDTRHFQSWTRDVLCGPPPSPCPTPCGMNSNLSNGLTLTFLP